MTMSKTLTETVRPLGRVREWVMNPRGARYEGMEELRESLREVGLQDAIHVWLRPDGDYLLKGHRRFRAMCELGWEECRMVVHEFGDEAEAYLYLLQDHGHTVALNADEKLVAMMNGVGLGMTVHDLAPALGVTEDRAQLWFDLGEGLPQCGREALASGEMSLNVAELVLRVDEGRRREAVQLVLRDSISGEPMGFHAAQNFIQATYVLPDKWRREWLGSVPKLRKKYAADEGFHFVEWEDRGDFVMGESGQPQPEYEYGDGMVSRGGELWMTRAQSLGVPVYVVPAPRHADKFVLVVHRKMVRDAEAVAVPEERETEGGKVSGYEFQVSGGEAVGTEPAVAVSGLSEAMTDWLNERELLKVWLRVWLGAIYEALSSNPTVVMTSEPWKPLHGFLARLVTDVDAGAAEAWLGIREAEEMLAWMGKDKRQRAPLRLALMLLLCAESDASEKPMGVIREVGVALGLDAAALDGKAEEGGGL